MTQRDESAIPVNLEIALIDLATARDTFEVAEGRRNAIIRELLSATTLPLADIAQAAGLHQETLRQWKRRLL